MNAITTTGGNSLVPHDMNGAMQLAQMMATSKLVPDHLQKSAGDCLLVIEQAMRWNMSPFAVAQCTSVINKKLMFEGKLVAAAVQTSGVLASRLKYTFAGDGNTRSITVIGELKGEVGEPRDITVRLADAKTTNPMWTKQPDQQLVYFASRAWARRHTPEVMLGVYSPEEFDAPKDNFTGTTIEVRPDSVAARMMDNYDAGKAAIRPDPEQVMQPMPPPAKTRTWGTFLDELDPELAAAQTAEEVDAILARPLVHKAQNTLQNGARDRLQHMIDTAIKRTSGDPPDMDSEAEYVNDPANGAV